jgi:crotonobetainyl-CoA:carnitine CoA-transferase CaiB-like acyl-CoA transferase
VVDLSALWAGPLCGSLLAAGGARVIKVESEHRPDGARRGPPAFFDLLNGPKASVALDLRSDESRSRLGRLLRAADVVIEGSRPRALEQMGLFAERIVSEGGPQVWVSITAYGREGVGRERIGFGDDAAVGGGLVVRDDAGPCFCADAVADPATGLVAAAAVVDALSVGGRWIADVPLSGVAASLAGPTLEAPPGTTPEAPRARTPSAHAAAFGADTAEVLAWLERGR